MPVTGPEGGKWGLITDNYLPAQPRLRNVDTGRIFQVFAAQVCHFGGVPGDQRHQQHGGEV